MSDVKKYATREGYGAGLLALAKKHDNIVVLDADLAAATKTGMFKRNILKSTLIAVLLSAI